MWVILGQNLVPSMDIDVQIISMEKTLFLEISNLKNFRWVSGTLVLLNLISSSTRPNGEVRAQKIISYHVSLSNDDGLPALKIINLYLVSNIDHFYEWEVCNLPRYEADQSSMLHYDDSIIFFHFKYIKLGRPVFICKILNLFPLLFVFTQFWIRYGKTFWMKINGN